MNNPKKESLSSVIYNSMVRNNLVLVLGTAIAPVIVVANTLKNAAILALTFSVITFFTMLLSSFIPQKLVYTVRGNYLHCNRCACLCSDSYNNILAVSAGSAEYGDIFSFAYNKLFYHFPFGYGFSDRKERQNGA